MPSIEDSKEREKPDEGALMARLKRFVEDSELSFYQIASRVGTSGVMLSMWLAGTVRPDAAEWIQIERFLKESLGDSPWEVPS
jgi:DNA transposition AAA+ family ATPase